jgi:predicted nucleotidyltransferase
MKIEELEKELKRVEFIEKKEEKVSEEVYSKVVKFTNEARKQYGELIKSVLIFGSAVRGELRKTSDIDVWVILDDTATKTSEEANRITSHLYLISRELKDLHIQVTNLTEFWRMLRMGSPELTNFLRHGLPIYDSGFIKPVQRMLQMGLLAPTKEAVSLKVKASELRLKRIRLDLKTLIFDLRYCATDMAQAAIMYHFKEQPDPKEIPKFLEKFVKDGKLKEEYLNKYNELNELWKNIEHGKIKEVGIEHLRKAMELAEKLVEGFKKLIPERGELSERKRGKN